MERSMVSMLVFLWTLEGVPLTFHISPKIYEGRRWFFKAHWNSILAEAFTASMFKLSVLLALCKHKSSSCQGYSRFSRSHNLQNYLHDLYLCKMIIHGLQHLSILKILSEERLLVGECWPTLKILKPMTGSKNQNLFFAASAHLHKHACRNFFFKISNSRSWISHESLLPLLVQRSLANFPTKSTT